MVTDRSVWLAKGTTNIKVSQIEPEALFLLLFHEVKAGRDQIELRLGQLLERGHHPVYHVIAELGRQRLPFGSELWVKRRRIVLNLLIPPWSLRRIYTSGAVLLDSHNCNDMVSVVCFYGKVKEMKMSRRFESDLRSEHDA